jgi:hypothetical protein
MNVAFAGGCCERQNVGRRAASGTWNVISWWRATSLDEQLLMWDRLRRGEPVDYQYGFSARRSFTLSE